MRKSKNNNNLRHLLLHVARGEQDKAKDLLKKYPELLFKEGSVTDDSGRTFNDITAFQYAVWALNRPMWTMIFKCFPKNDEGKKAIIKQFEDLEKEGTKYGRHYNLIPLINALKKYISARKDGFLNPDEIARIWCEEVGGAQRTLPAHVVKQYYCRPYKEDESGFPYPKKDLPRNMVINMPVPKPKSSFPFASYTGSTYKKVDWFPLKDGKDGEGLGFSFAICFTGRESNAFPSSSICSEIDMIKKYRQPRTSLSLKWAENNLNDILGLSAARVKDYDYLSKKIDKLDDEVSSTKQTLESPTHS